MARTIAELPQGARITDFISLGVISTTFPMEKIQEILHTTGTAGARISTVLKASAMASAAGCIKAQ